MTLGLSSPIGHLSSVQSNPDSGPRTSIPITAAPSGRHTHRSTWGALLAWHLRHTHECRTGGTVIVIALLFMFV